MPRIPRGGANGGTYHVLNRGNAKREVFSSGRDYAAFVGLLKAAKAKYPISLFGYCLMPNHFHLVLCSREEDGLSQCMQWLMTSHVRRHHKRKNTSGHIWQGRYKSFLIQEDAHLIAVLRYVERNPVRAGLASAAWAWRWSSHRERIGWDALSLLDPGPVSLPPDWSGFIRRPLTRAEIERVRRSVRRRTPFGSPGWQEQVCGELGLESTLRPRGRPKKRSEK
jgi:putative transposase